MSKKAKKKIAKKKTARAKVSAKKSSGAKSAKPAAKKKAMGQTSRGNPKLTKPAQVKITAAKGRPMLSWVGKRPLSHVTAFPTQLVERHDALRILGIPVADDRTYKDRIQVLRDLRSQWNAECWRDAPHSLIPAPEHGGLLFHGDNKEVLAHLLANGYRGKINLVYIDPPFDSGADYVRKVSLRGPKGTAKLDGEGYTLGEQVQYTDIWANDNYLQFMYERLQILRELLADDGSIYVQCDPRRSHHSRCLLDEVFGTDSFRAELVWKRTSAHSDASFFGAVHDTILFYTKGQEPTWNQPLIAYDDWYVERYFRYKDDDGRRFKSGDLSAYGLSGDGYTYTWKGKEGLWRCPRSTMEKLDQEGCIHYTENGIPRLKQYLDKIEGMPVQSVWDDIQPVVSWSTQRTSYPTQKPELLLSRMVNTSSNPGDLVLDCFIGSGTTAAIAQQLGRRWIGCDINKGAIQTTAKRLRTIIAGQIEEARKRADEDRQGNLPGTSDDDRAPPPKPAQFGFAVWRVNDYDLNIQHNEAVNLACEHIGVQRTRTDVYFDGTLGRKLVKIIPFGHPLTPLDLDELRRELDARPDEDRNITLVCLGMELAATAWVENWNRLRKSKSAVNRIEVIELRTDPKYGKFIKHEPAKVRIKITRKNAKVVVEILDFISPTIIERLQQQAGILQPKIEDWRAMVDCVMIDPAYDGNILNVAVDDIPAKKSDLVVGKYEIPAPADETTVAVKIIDMLGEEVLVTKLA